MVSSRISARPPEVSRVRDIRVAPTSTKPHVARPAAVVAATESPITSNVVALPMQAANSPPLVANLQSPPAPSLPAPPPPPPVPAPPPVDPAIRALEEKRKKLSAALKTSDQLNIQHCAADFRVALDSRPAADVKKEDRELLNKADARLRYLQLKDSTLCGTCASRTLEEL